MGLTRKALLKMGVKLSLPAISGDASQKGLMKSPCSNKSDDCYTVTCFIQMCDDAACSGNSCENQAGVHNCGGAPTCSGTSCSGNACEQSACYVMTCANHSGAACGSKVCVTGGNG